MAAFDFPPTPAVGTLYPLVAEVGKPQYRWNGSEWIAATLDPAGYVRKSGDAMTGALSLAGDPTQALHAVPKQYLDAQTQRISLEGVRQVDVQVPTGARAAKLVGAIWSTSAAPCNHMVQLSVAAGVFISNLGDYAFYGFQQNSVNAVITNSSNVTTVPGMYINSHSHATLPMTFNGTLQLKRPNTSTFFTSEFVSAAWGTNVTNSFMTNHTSLVSVGSALGILAFRLIGSTSDVWRNESYLEVRWIY